MDKMARFSHIFVYKIRLKEINEAEINYCMSGYPSTLRPAVMPARAVPSVQEWQVGAISFLFPQRNPIFSRN